MEQYETEEQQVEAIKRFWKENGLSLVIGALLGLGGLLGWRYYNDSQIEAKEQASFAFRKSF
ncbi:TPR-like domain-containing protein [Paraglaciecola psychrophila 170]|uniref:TPR-like domain-containing protein n=1 Tax=Paraglaciecola psychrophila 170 TaxID=1129794 RepID=M4RUJ9_9ALTE|nr:TPR-like domain-containing protein [Paraglaciecola psychrophila 170]